MNYQALLYFKTVAELQHLTKAANQLYITQPALTKALQNLEKEIGYQLIEKSGRNIQLTKYGVCFYPYIKEALNNMDQGLKELQHLSEIESGVIHISSLPSLICLYLTNEIASFKQTHSSCKFNIEFKFTSAVIQDVLIGNSELGICSNLSDKKKNNNIVSAKLYDEPVCFIASSRNPLTKKNTLSENEISGYPFIAYHISHLGTNMIYETICHKFGKEPNYIMEAYNDFGVLNGVVINDAIAIVSQDTIINYKFDNIRVLNVKTSAPLTRSVNLIWARDSILGKSVLEFREHLIKDAPIFK